MLVSELSKSDVAKIYYNKYLYEVENISRLGKIAKKLANLPEIEDPNKAKIYSFQKKLYKRLTDLIAEGFIETDLDPIITIGDLVESIQIATNESLAEIDPNNTEDKQLIVFMNTLLGQITNQITSEYSKQYYTRDRVTNTLQLVLNATAEHNESYTDILTQAAYEQMQRGVYTLEEALEQVDETMCLLGDPEEIVDNLIKTLIPEQLREMEIPEELIGLMDLQPLYDEAKENILPSFRTYFSKIEEVIKADIQRIYS